MRSLNRSPAGKPLHFARGFTLIEVLITMVIAALLLGTVMQFVAVSERSLRAAQAESEIAREADFAIDRISRAVRGARFCFVPLNENPATAHSESVRSVLAVSLDPRIDRDMDGWADANNDRDWVDENNNGSRDPGEPERTDEDPGHDLSNDAAPGLVGVDDDGDGQVDELMVFEDPLKSDQDDDEDGWKNEDNYNGYDDDGDGQIDEDIKQEISDDHAPGLLLVDDNLDGLVDDHPAYSAYGGPDSKEARRDDDEDGLINEDGPDAVVFFLGGTEVYASSGNGTPDGPVSGEPGVLYERLPDLNATDGRDFTDRPIASGVTSFTVTRLPRTPGNRYAVLDIELVLGAGPGTQVTRARRLRVGEAM